ncbi:hypothetical protein BDW59DRAFT_145705 [Aspergillus cavernicola]|uniref:Putative gamma-glutamylcyclotransferase n=1 Tax=Aspergillus cavernicola TaxID=176166 RepID=A0ABR4IE21_9EURO
MGDHVLFFYGTLMAPQILHRVIHGSPTPHQWQKDLLHFRPAILHGYRRHRVRGADYPGIISSSSSSSASASHSSAVQDLPAVSTSTSTSISTSTHTTLSVIDRQAPPPPPSVYVSVLGTVVSGLTDGDLHRLDIFEGSDYSRQKVSVRILREALLSDPDVGGRDGSSTSHGNGGDGDRDGNRNSDRHLKDVLEAAGADFADEGEEIEAETYVWISARRALEDAEWDFEAFKRDKMAWWVAADESEW